MRSTTPPSFSPRYTPGSEQDAEKATQQKLSEQKPLLSKAVLAVLQAQVSQWNSSMSTWDMHIPVHHCMLTKLGVQQPFPIDSVSA
jgi:hypothetical protein